MPVKGSITPLPSQKGKKDPIGVYHFSVLIDGVPVARFTDASGFEHSTKIIEYRECDSEGNIHINKVIGSTSFSEVTLKRGITDDNKLWTEWRQKVMDGDYDGARQTVTIIGHSPKGETTAEFKIQNAWVSKWKGPAFSAAGSTVAFEEITFTHEGITRTK